MLGLLKGVKGVLTTTKKKVKKFDKKMEELIPPLDAEDAEEAIKLHHLFGILGVSGAGGIATKIASPKKSGKKAKENAAITAGIRAKKNKLFKAHGGVVKKSRTGHTDYRGGGMVYNTRVNKGVI